MKAAECGSSHLQLRSLCTSPSPGGGADVGWMRGRTRQKARTQKQLPGPVEADMLTDLLG